MDSIVAQFDTSYRSQRLTYRPFEDNDEDKSWWFKEMSGDMVGEGLADPNLLKAKTRAASDELVKMFTKDILLGVIICLPPSDTDDAEAKPTKIGFLSMNGRGPSHLSAMIGLRITSQYRDKGYGREAINWSLDWAFRWQNLHRISIGTVSFNDRALALYRSMGFVEEGRTREALYFNLGWHDLISFGMLRDEWKALHGIA